MPRTVAETAAGTAAETAAGTAAKTMHVHSHAIVEDTPAKVSEENPAEGGPSSKHPSSNACSSASLVTDATNFLEALKRLHTQNEAITFWNEERSFRIMLRSDPIDDDTMNFELVIAAYQDDEDVDGSFAKLLDLEHDGYMEEDCTSFVMDDFTIDLSDSPADDAVTAGMDKLNKMYRMKVCPCYRYFIKDMEDACSFCVMTATRQDVLEQQTCPICQEKGLRNQLRAQPCCKQQMHPRCLAAWQGKPCPLCRAEPIMLF